MTAMNDTQLSDYVTFTTADQIFGLPIECVQDVFKPSRITRVPLAGPEIAGVLNLRGRIVTAIELRSRLGLAARDAGIIACRSLITISRSSWLLRSTSLRAPLITKLK